MSRAVASSLEHHLAVDNSSHDAGLVKVERRDPVRILVEYDEIGQHAQGNLSDLSLQVPVTGGVHGEKADRFGDGYRLLLSE
jgi:hypothetical protein